MKLRLSSLIGFGALLAFAGCDTQDELQVLPGLGDHTPDGKIYNGSGPDAPEHDAVVALHQLTKDGTSVYVQPFCSGTLIDSQRVLTAAHCLDTAKGGKPGFAEMNASQLAIYVGDDPSVDLVDNLYLVSDLEIYPTYNRFSLLNDLAMVKLASAVPGSVTPVPNLPTSEAFSASDVGGSVNFAGFGDDETGGSGVKLQVDGTIGGFGCAVSGCSGSGDYSTQVSYAQGGGGPCFGDSGGPMFIERASGTYVAGVTSYGDSACLVYGVSTRVDAYDSWISNWGTTGDSGGDSGGMDTDTGGGETGLGSCGDGVCDPNESCDGRDGTTACSDDCAGKTNGKPSTRYCYVGDTCEGPGC